MDPTLNLPEITDRHAFNRRRWEEASSDPLFSQLEHRIETDRCGKIIMTPPAGFDHSDRQSEIVYQLRVLLPAGKAVPECPLSTSDGVKALDVAWISKKRLGGARQGNLLVKSPEICVEVLSPSNTRDEIDEKRRLYFEGGAEEVWICDLEGRMFFFLRESPETAAEASRLCPSFPRQIDLHF